jgi:hypothetical protein
LDFRTLKIVVPVLFFVTCLGVPVISAQPPLGAFVGQQITYDWSLGFDASDLFPGHDAQITISATVLHTVQRLLVDGFEALVEAEASIQWPADSINRNLNRSFVEYLGADEWNTSFELLGSSETFELNYLAYIHETGAVEAFTGNMFVRFWCGFPGYSYFFGNALGFDPPGQRGIFFLDEVQAEIGTQVGVWGIFYGTVLDYETLETPIGSRPAIAIETELEYESPTFNNSLLATYNYDQETGFLLGFDYFETREGYVDSQHGSSYLNISGDITNTNMYLPRFEHVLPWLLVIIIPCCVLVVSVLIYRRYLRSP